MVSTLPEFRRDFSGDLLRPGTTLRVARVALLFTDLTDSTALYSRVGDAKAFKVVHEHFDLLLGIIAARRKGTIVDYSASALALSGLSIPNFWLGIMLILVVAVHLKWLPASGFESIFVDPKAAIERLIMPALVLGGGLSAFIMRHTRSAMLEVLRSDYVRTARAKGLDEQTVVNRHALRNALIPIITLSTLLFGELLAGAVLTEQVFTIPGFGKLIVDAVFNRDYAVVQGVVLFTATAYILLNLLADIAYFLVNPRLRDGYARA